MSLAHLLSTRLHRPSRFAPRRKTPAAQRVFRAAFETLEERRLFSTLTVLNISDGGAGSLRAQITAAHNGDTIVFAPSLAGQTITLTRGELLIGHNVNVAGPGAGQITLSGNHISRVFEVVAGMQVTLSGLTISNGLAPGGNGGGILNAGTLTVSASNLSGNSANLQWKGNKAAGGEGGGIYNSGTLTVNSNSTLSGNTAGNGAGIDNVGMLTINNSALLSNAGNGINNTGTSVVSGCIISGNSAWQGAGIRSNGTLTVMGSTLVGNLSSGGGGGGIANMGTGTVSVSGCTLTGNSCSNNGGGIFNQGTLMLSDSTLTGNSAANDGGGICIGYYATATVSGSTVTGNSAAQGGGIWNWHNALTVENSSSITGNTAQAGFGADVYNLGLLYVDASSSIGALDGNPAMSI